MSHAFSPKTLGVRWGCSAETIRQMCNRGELTSFRPGPKLIRILAQEVDRFECQTTVLSCTEGNTVSPTPDPLAGCELRLARLTVVGRSSWLGKSGEFGPSPRRDG